MNTLTEQLHGLLERSVANSEIAGANLLVRKDGAELVYTQDIRWDLYKQLGYPEVNNLDDLVQVLTDMKALCPTDDNGNETYGVSLWPD